MQEAIDIIRSIHTGVDNNIYDGVGIKSLILFLQTSQKFKIETPPPEECIYFATECINNGIFQLPYPLTFLTWKEDLTENGESAALCLQGNNAITVIAFSRFTAGMNWCLDTDFVVPLLGDENFVEHSCSSRFHPPEKKVEGQKESYAAIVHPQSPFHSDEAHREFVNRAKAEGKTPRDVRAQNAQHFFEQIRGTVVMLKSQSIQLRDIKPSRQQIRAAKRQATLPPFEYKIAKINIDTIYKNDGNASYSEKRSPRMHWRRGHIRKLNTGVLIPVSPCVVGCASNGIIQKEYRARIKGQNPEPPQRQNILSKNLAEADS